MQVLERRGDATTPPRHKAREKYTSLFRGDDSLPVRMFRTSRMDSCELRWTHISCVAIMSYLYA